MARVPVRLGLRPLVRSACCSHRIPHHHALLTPHGLASDTPSLQTASWKRYRLHFSIDAVAPKPTSISINSASVKRPFAPAPVPLPPQSSYTNTACLCPVPPDVYAAVKILKPPSVVNATRLAAFAPHATSLAEMAFLTGSDQLLEALVYCCTETLPDPAAARNWPV